MLLLRSVTLKNFLSHADTTVDFSEHCRKLIDGISGSGKSSLIDALVWALFGRGRSDNRSLIRRGAKSASVTVALVKDKREYRVTRSINTTGKHTVNISAETGDGFAPVPKSGLRDLQAFIERDLLHASYSLFVNSIVTPQNSQDSFILATNEQRKDLILEMINASDYDAYYDKARDLLIESKEQLAYLSGGIETNKAAMAELATQLIKLPELREKEAKERTVEENLIKQLEEKESQIKEGTLLEQQLSMLISRIDQLDSSIKKLTFMETREEITAKISESEEACKAFSIWNEKHESLLGNFVSNDRIAAAEREVERVNKIIISLMSSPVEECPETRRPCPVQVRAIQKRIDEESTRLKTVTDEYATLRDRRDDWERKSAQLGEKPEYNSENHFYLVQQLEARTHTDENVLLIKQCNAEIESIHKRLAEIPFLKDLQDSISALKELKKDHDENLLELRAAILGAEACEKRLEELRAGVYKMETAIKRTNEDATALEAIKEAFGAKGVKTLVIEYIIPQLEAKINVILGQLSDLHVTIETQRSGASGENIIEGLFVQVTNNAGESFDLANYSGGEKTRISAAIAEGFASLQNTCFRIFDESIIGLDTQTIDGFISVLNSLNGTIGQMICVSHIQPIKDLFPEQILITKTAGISSVS